jgi:large subunit ribosomal protein L1
MEEKILAKVKELKEKSKKRNFSQTFDLVVSLKEFDIKKAENKFAEDVVLPHGRGRDASVVLFSDSIKDVDCEIYTNEKLQSVAKSKRLAKTLVKRTDFFLAEPKLMPAVGKILGAYAAPRGKMPKLITGDIKTLVKNYKKSVRMKIKDSPVVQCFVGKEDMKDEQIVENIEAALKFLETKLPKGKANVGKILLKLTMGKPIKLEV